MSANVFSPEYVLLSKYVFTYDKTTVNIQADSMFASSQWETALLCNDVFH